MKQFFIWLPEGGLGNLIFQYQAVRSLSGSSTVLAMASDFFDTFETSSRFIVFPCLKRIRWRLHIFWLALFRGLAKRKWVGTVEPGKQPVIDGFESESLEIKWTKGRLANVYLVRGYFQSAAYLKPLPRVKPHVLHDAERILSSVPKPQRVAIHMRFGDYIRWPVFGVPGAACLPEAYFLKGLTIIESAVPTAHYFVLSDEPERAKEILRSVDVGGRVTIVENGSTASDFALMASCAHAILSASSFSWWAATLVDCPDRILIAPRYWIGFRRRAWYPAHIGVGHFLYIDPLQEEAGTPAECKMIAVAE